MNFELVFKELLQKFEDEKIHYALIGGFALHVAGFTRATKDIDFMVEAQDLFKVKNIMEKLGYELVNETTEFSNYWHPMGPLGCVDYLHAHREYSRKMLKRAKKHTILKSLQIPVLIPEDIIGLKIQAIVSNPKRYSQDMADIEYLLKENAGRLNLDMVREYFELFERGKELDEILKRVKHA